MTMKKILIIFLSLILAVGCSSEFDPRGGSRKSIVDGGGQLNDYGDGDLIENGSDNASQISAFINKYEGIYYLDGQVKYKLKNGKLYENRSWQFTEVTSGITVEPNGVKMQISNLGDEGKIEVLNFRRQGDSKDGFSSYSSFILVKEDAVDTSMHRIGQSSSLTSFKGTYKSEGEKFLSIDGAGNIYFKEAVSGSHVSIRGKDLTIADSYNKNIITFEEGNVYYRKYARSGDDDVTVYSCSVTRDFIESLGEVAYANSDRNTVKKDKTKIVVELNKFEVNDKGVSIKLGSNPQSYPDCFIIADGSGYIMKEAKYAILKGNTITVFESKYKVSYTLTFSEDRSECAYTKGGSTIILNRI